MPLIHLKPTSNGFDSERQDKMTNIELCSNSGADLQRSLRNRSAEGLESLFHLVVFIALLVCLFSTSESPVGSASSATNPSAYNDINTAQRAHYEVGKAYLLP